HAAADVWFLTQAPASLGDKVGQLTQAMAEFANNTAVAPAAPALPGLPADARSLPLQVRAMADTLGRFDAHGKLLPVPALAAPGANRLPAPAGPDSGWLALPPR
ncbi:MAG TPA: hypothetical protein VFG03_21460, partial [Telluria sp.]|nr:hypothetical protein [Telluria sp.]